MSLIYRVMYRVGFTPWDNGHVSEELSALVEGADALQAGRALDVELGRVGLEPGFTLVFDRGCFHGLNDEQRAAYAAGATALAAPGATLLMMSFAPSRMLAAPPGVDETEIVARFDRWELADTQSDRDAPPPGPMKNVPRRWTG